MRQTAPRAIAVQHREERMPNQRSSVAPLRVAAAGIRWLLPVRFTGYFAEIRQRTHETVVFDRLMTSSPIRFPERLRDALRDGRLVVFAGAGVSMGKPASLPDFSTLADSIAADTGVDRRNQESDDAFLGRLHHQGVQVHEIAARQLQTNRCGETPAPTDLHRDLLRLYPNSGAVRIVTTNFDRLFDTAAQAVFPGTPELFRAPALPLGRSFNGIVHVHGRLDRPHELVLTDADFGRAYLIDGWARRFLVELFRSFTVMFVGYSHDDTVMR
ncbi:MAG: hypothetical protein F4187_03890, partial [Gemmatimonadetes bacterium]|nr:hypothetical protein [Gemmatimonadota bacterium]